MLFAGLPHKHVQLLLGEACCCLAKHASCLAPHRLLQRQCCCLCQVCKVSAAAQGGCRITSPVEALLSRKVTLLGKNLRCPSTTPLGTQPVQQSAFEPAAPLHTSAIISCQTAQIEYSCIYNKANPQCSQPLGWLALK